MKPEPDKETYNVQDSTEGNNSPDGGWGWAVVIASLFINIIYDGCSYSFGILFINLLEYFGDTKSNTAWIGSLFFSVPLLCGPIAGVITDKLGTRSSTMIGGAVAAIGFALGSFANSIWSLCICYGIVAGFGMSIPYFNSSVTVAQYFTKRRGLATSISECGAGVGTIIFAPLTEFLISAYGWRGALLILSGIVANIMVCGALFRPIEHLQNVADNNITVEECYQKNDISCNQQVDTVADDCLNENIQQEMKLITNSIHSSQPDLKVTDIKDFKASSYANLSQVNGLHVSKLTRSCLNIRSFEMEDNVVTESVTLETENIKPRKIFFLFTVWKQFRANSGAFKSIRFALFTLSNFVLYFWYDVPYVFIVDKSISMGIDVRSATFIVSIIGIVHTIGNIVYGILSDRKCVNRALLYSISIVLCGVSILVVPLMKDHASLSIAAGCFGLFSAANEAMCAVILVDIVGLKGLNHAYGLIMFLQGVANLVGPPVAGFIVDVTGEYDAMFYAAGSFIIAAVCVYLCHSIVQSFKFSCKGLNK